MKKLNLFKPMILLSGIFLVSCGSNTVTSSSSSSINHNSSTNSSVSSISSTVSSSSSLVSSSTSKISSISSSSSSLSTSVSSSVSSTSSSSSSSSSSPTSSSSTTTSSSSSISTPSKEELIEGYRLHFSDPKLTKVGDQADDIYLKATIEEDGIKLDMVGFGTLLESEYVKVIIHTSEKNSSGWNIQSDDVTFLISKSKAYHKSGMTAFWDYVNFGNDTKCINSPEYVDHISYFTLSFKIDFQEVPEYTKYKNVSMYAMEFNNGAIYDGIDYNNGMLIDGKSHGDPAAQSSYFVIQEKSLPEDQQELVKEYNYQFSIGNDNIFAKFERKTSSLILNMLSFSTFDEEDYIRFIVKTGNDYQVSWALEESDMSFSIYKDACYYQTGVDSFWTNEKNQFHGQDQTINKPVYNETEEYWTLSIEFEYSEFSLSSNILKDTTLRGILVEFTPDIANNGFKQDGVTLDNIANQENYFSF